MSDVDAAQLGPLRVEGDGVYVRGVAGEPFVRFTSSGLVVEGTVEREAQIPWKDIDGIGIDLPVLPLYLWWALLPVQALSGPTTSEFEIRRVRGRPPVHVALRSALGPAA